MKLTKPIKKTNLKIKLTTHSKVGVLLFTRADLSICMTWNVCLERPILRAQPMPKKYLACRIYKRIDGLRYLTQLNTILNTAQKHHSYRKTLPLYHYFRLCLKETI